MARRLDQKRILIAQEAARILSTERNRDFLAAKKRAAERLGMDDRKGLPSNLEVEEALIELQRLYSPEGLDDNLGRLRQAALEAMRVFAKFQPRLAGPVLTGSAHADTIIEVHLFAESPKEVLLFLIEQGVPFESAERRYRTGRDYEYIPVFRFDAGDASFELAVFPPISLRQAPMSPVDGRPMQRAGIGDVQELLKIAAQR